MGMAHPSYLLRRYRCLWRDKRKGLNLYKTCPAMTTEQVQQNPLPKQEMEVIKKSETYLFDKAEELKQRILKEQQSGWIVEQLDGPVLHEPTEKLLATVRYKNEKYLVQV